MKIAVIDTGFNELTGKARAFLPELLKGLTAGGGEVHLITKGEPDEDFSRPLEESNAILHANLWNADGLVEVTAPVLAKWLNELGPDIYFIWASEDVGWTVLPLLNPQIATLAVGHADSEIFYRPARHYRSFLTRVIGATPEVCVGFVISCVIDKERVEWISYNETETGETFLKIIETYESCFEKAVADTLAAPRETTADFPSLKTTRPASGSWFGKLKAKIMN